MSFIMSLILTIIGSVVMTSIGYGITTWQWWVIILLIVLNHYNGKSKD